MKRWLKPDTLLGRTVLALALAFLVFAVLSVTFLQVTLVKPHTRQAADDLASLLVLTAKIYVELPPYTRPDYRRELLEHHELRIIESEAAHPTVPNAHEYLNYLAESLEARLGEPVTIHHHPDYEGWLWTDFPLAGRIIRIGFKSDRLQRRLLLILPFLSAFGIFVAFVLSALLVRHITRPLAAMSAATVRIGQGDFSESIAESGPREIAELAHKLNQMESHIGRLVRNRTTLLAGISHDLRTPLARMRIELEMLRGNENRELIAGLANDIDEMDALISQTLLLARGLGSEAEPEVETDLCELIRQTVEILESPGAEIALSLAGECRQPAKANSLKRVIGNLLENALAYGDGKPVSVRYQADPDEIRIEVTDRGPGIPPEEREAIFQPFHRLEGSRNKTTGGSGLGLAIVQQLCAANGWQIEVNPAPGGGTTFTLRLPRAAAPGV